MTSSRLKQLFVSQPIQILLFLSAFRHSLQLKSHGVCDFGSQGSKFESCRVQSEFQSRLTGGLSHQQKRAKKFVSQSLATFEVQIAADRAFPGGIRTHQDSILGTFDDATRHVTLPGT